MHSHTVSDPVQRVAETLDAVLELRDDTTYRHSSRVVDLSFKLGRNCGLDNASLALLGACARFHDIGKIAIPDRILKKNGKLSRGEYRTMQQHASIGASLVRQIRNEEIGRFADIIEHHHERFDGRGYPHGLKGNSIPMLARIIAVVDTYDAITSHRRYHAPYPNTYALETIEREQGRQFDPDIAQEFLTLAGEME